jgi:hypothetical protein
MAGALRRSIPVSCIPAPVICTINEAYGQTPMIEVVFFESLTKIDEASLNAGVISGQRPPLSPDGL